MSTRVNLRTTPRSPLTPEALETLERVARTGSFAGAAREMGKVPSALTYSMRALEDALDVLLFDRSSRQARLTPAGEELLREGRRLLRDLDALANRVKRVATGWESAFTVAVDGIIAMPALLSLTEAFYALRPPTRLTLREEILSGTGRHCSAVRPTSQSAYSRDARQALTLKCVRWVSCRSCS